ncbi:hypothetical protein [Streptomonospora arabica]|uniref:Uncharacterized protein n=1 Tax=Streptomonospora arabica TaxID=412417 RepID=A0ABV9SPN1_9ACTN
MVTPAQSAPNILDEFNQPYLNERYEREYDDTFTTVSTADASVVQADTAGKTDFSGSIVQVKRGGGNKGGDDNSNGDNDRNGNGNNDDRRNNGNTYRFDNDLEYYGDQGQGQQQGASAGGGFELAWGNPLGLVGQLMEMSTTGQGGGPESPMDSPSHRTLRMGKARR